MLDSVFAIFYRLAKWAAIGAGVLILLAALLVFADVMLRNIVNYTLGGADELSGYALAIGTAWALPYCLLGKHHIRIDSLYRITGVKTRALLDIISLMAIGAFILLLTYRAGLVLLETAERNSLSVGPLSLPQIWPQTLWVSGLVFTALAVALTALRGLLALARGDLERVHTVLANEGANQSDSGQKSVM